ncbi:acyltransferase [Shewanella sp. AC91-MNA-CIBAN-0169]|uniref:acyltransferase family protein n=1 Tax=Shewanella sp. AC91-MNA-CIBAN-0169 TaxID=3140466 RepID=UPI003316B559
MKYNNKKNSLNELRFYLAFVVVTIHMAFLTNTDLTKNILAFTYPLASRAVDLFFVLSGFLIYMSWDRKPSPKDYTYKRFFRLYPLYGLVVVSIPLIFWAVFDGQVDIEEIVCYLLANLTFMNFLYPTIPGLFEGNNHQIINGALWSLKVEVMFYIALPFIYWFIERAKKPVYIVFGLLLSSILFNFLLYGLEGFLSINLGPLYNQLPSKLYLFVLGIALYKYFDFFSCHFKHNTGLVSILLLCCVVLFFFELSFLFSIAVSILVLSLSFLNRKFAFFSSKADYSYSIYITHFPIIQVMLGLGVSFSTLVDLVMYLIVQSIVSIFCWKAIEFNFLRISHSLSRSF